LVVARFEARINKSFLTELQRKDRQRWQVATSLVTIAALVAIGACYVSWSEGWGAVDAVYWAVVSASSTGYGDLVIKNETTRWFCIVYLLIAVGGFAMSLSKFSSIVMEVEAERAMNEFVNRGVSMAMIEEMDVDGSGSVDRAEFLRYMLITMGKVGAVDLDKLLGIFAKLDRDGKGKLDEGDLRAAATPGPKPILGNESRGEALGGPILGKSSGSVVTSSTTVFGWTGMDLPNMDSESADLESSSEGDSSASGLLPEDVIGVRTGSRTPWQRSIQRVTSSIQRASVWLLGAAVGALPSSALKAYFELRLSLSQLTTVKLADAGVAAGSLAATVWVLHALDEWGGLRPLTFFSTPMLASAVLFFAGPTPPPPMTFVISTLGAFVIGLTMHHASNASVSGIGSVGAPALESVGTHASAHHGALRGRPCSRVRGHACECSPRRPAPPSPHRSVGAQCLAAGLLLFFFKGRGLPLIAIECD